MSINTIELVESLKHDIDPADPMTCLVVVDTCLECPVLAQPISRNAVTATRNDSGVPSDDTSTQQPSATPTNLTRHNGDIISSCLYRTLAGLHRTMISVDAQSLDTAMIDSSDDSVLPLMIDRLTTHTGPRMQGRLRPWLDADMYEQGEALAFDAVPRLNISGDEIKFSLIVCSRQVLDSASDTLGGCTHHNQGSQCTGTLCFLDIHDPQVILPLHGGSLRERFGNTGLSRSGGGYHRLRLSVAHRNRNRNQTSADSMCSLRTMLNLPDRLWLPVTDTFALALKDHDGGGRSDNIVNESSSAGVSGTWYEETVNGGEIMQLAQADLRNTDGETCGYSNGSSDDEDASAAPLLSCLPMTQRKPICTADQAVLCGSMSLRCFSARSAHGV